jgi:hypothetical protein
VRQRCVDNRCSDKSQAWLHQVISMRTRNLALEMVLDADWMLQLMRFSSFWPLAQPG